LLGDGGRVLQETRLYDPDRKETRSMRSKEDAHDYRYFPDPDLLPLVISAETIEQIRSELPELPQARRERYRLNFGLPSAYAVSLTQSIEAAAYFEEVLGVLGSDAAKLAANWVLGELAGALNSAAVDISASPVSSKQLAGLLRRILDNTVSGKMAKDVFVAIWAGEGDADLIIEKRGLKQMSDSDELDKIVDAVLTANPKSVEEFRAGKEKAFNALVGQAMKATKGKGNPAQINEILKKKLAG
jgi:aspartyl-tRNA(Asn)/glutamyl-tRNA(Gln) amidotransferase subunit B